VWTSVVWHDSIFLQSMESPPNPGRFRVPVIWKLCVHPSRRGDGIGPRLIAAITHHLPKGTDRLRVETFAVNQRASAFYEREGFRKLCR
jgi:ribosomal protein S18 acetylase RimI-like enzyme